jgi:penicillin-binding protein 1C
MTSRRLLVIASVAAALVGAIYLRVGPLPRGLLDPPHTESTEIADRTGELLYEARGDDGMRASWLTPEKLPQPLVDATLAAEDRRFFGHPGIDPVAVVRAAARNLRNLRWLEGGSTITQQVVKLLLARRGGAEPRNFGAKLREGVLALRLEHRLTKREILALYLNLAPYGNQLSGAERASRAYFGHDASLLTSAQSAYLAALPQRPSSYNPYRDPSRARARQERVIAQMGLSGALDPGGVRAAMNERLTLVREDSTFIAPHFVERVLEQAGESRPRRIVTTLDASLQREVSGIIRAARPALERHGAHNVSAVVLDNATGEWLAWEGSGNYDDAEHGGRIDGVITPRQPGSALKPFTYALAFEEGETPATVLPDVQSYFPTARDGVVYSPRNYDNQFRGPLLARRALAGSENVPAVALAAKVGVPNLLRFMRSAGLSTFDKNGAYYGLGVTLGDAEVRLDELVAAYSVFARGGTAITPTMIRSATPPDARPLISARTAFWITDILSDDEARAFAFGRGGSLEFPFAVAAKTGTSQAYHDNWTIGYTREVTVGVWVGNFDRRPLVGSSGVTGAGPIFHAIMLAAASRASGALPDPQAPATAAAPERTTRRTICALSGLAATPECPLQVEEWMADESPTAVCDWHRQTPRGIVVDWPPAYRAWAATERLLNVVAVSARPSAARTSSEVTRAENPPALRSQLRIVNPPDGAVYLIDPTLRHQFQTIGFRGTTEAKARIEWHIDGEALGTTGPDAALDWPLTPGRHVISAHDTRGRHASAEIVVK